MDKTEFLDQLRQSLNGKVDAELVTENLRYYGDYIDSMMGNGMNEQEIMTSLGSPRLIARTIMDANLGGSDIQRSAGTQTQEAYQQESYSAEDFVQGGAASGKLKWLVKFFRLPRWMRYAVGIGAFLLVITILLKILEFLAPIIIMGAIALFLVKLFRDWLN